MTNEKECKGCYIEFHCNLKAYYIDDQDNKVECPCQICLIKGICRDLCNNFIVYRKNLMEYLHEKEMTQRYKEVIDILN